jgi:hypothetical protein
MTAPTQTDPEALIVISIDEAEQIIEASRAAGTAAEVIDALSMLVDRAARYAERVNALD